MPFVGNIQFYALLKQDIFCSLVQALNNLRILLTTCHSCYKCKAKECKLRLYNQNQQPLAIVDVFAIKNPVGDLRAVDWSKLNKQWPYLVGLNLLKPVKQGRVQMILGSKVCKLI